jgi:hypothetical protein
LIKDMWKFLYLINAQVLPRPGWQSRYHFPRKAIDLQRFSFISSLVSKVVYISLFCCCKQLNLSCRKRKGYKSQ